MIDIEQFLMDSGYTIKHNDGNFKWAGLDFVAFKRIEGIKLCTCKGRTPQLIVKCGVLDDNQIFEVQLIGKTNLELLNLCFHKISHESLVCNLQQLETCLTKAWENSWSI